MELFKHATGINAIAVHYKGGAQSGLGIMSGEVKVGFAALAGILPHVKAGRVKAFMRNPLVHVPQRVETMLTAK
jgi:tripartite-type tricarboxylate transporter receptor subunit TctC